MKKLAIISTIVLGLATASCDSYLDINQNPNSPQESNMTPSIMMPAAEMNFAAAYGDLLRIPGGYFSQHYAQTPGTSNYVDYSAFQMTTIRSSTAYIQLNSRALKSLQTIRELSQKSNDWGSYLAATTLRAFIYQVLVDAYGEIPYSEALDISHPSPKYDDGQDVYAGILEELNEALAKVNNADVVCTNFLFPGKTAASWIQFANALKLKILTRESGVVNVDNQIAALITEDNFPASDVAYVGCWSSESGSMNPYYAEEISTAWGSNQINVCANIALVGTMMTDSYTDPRLAAFFAPNNEGKYQGGISGTNLTSSFSVASFNRPTENWDSPVYLISKAEIEFFIAEYYAKAGNAAQAQAHYEAAIEASFASAGVDGAADNIANYPYDQNNYKKCIGLAKWLALSGVNNYESWCEMRRLDYPAFGTVTGDQIFTGTAINAGLYVPGTLYTPVQVFNQVGNNKLLERWPYADESTSANSSVPRDADGNVIFPGYTTPVFWGK